MLTIKQWFKQNQNSIGLLILLSLTAGIAIAALCFFSPIFFTAIASIAPLAFLATMNFPLALFTLSAVTAGVTCAASIIGTILVQHAINIGKHIVALFVKEPQTYKSAASTYNYLKSHLQWSDSQSFDYHEEGEFNETSASQPEDLMEIETSNSYEEADEQLKIDDNSLLSIEFC